MIEALRPTDPRQVGRYRLTGRLGDGGMGEVYLGQSPGGRPVAVKLIRSDLAENAAFRARFAQEVAAARRVSGIFTAPVVDADPDAEQPWLVTGYVAGPSLTEAVESRGPLTTHAVLSLAAGLAEGLTAIHAAGVVHRDLKPSNVLLAADGPRIIDFGISRALDSGRLTGTGSIVGSPGFMSPEQAEGGSVGPPSDIFSLGSVITFAACGEGPFGSGPATVLLYRIVHGTPVMGGVPASISSLIARSLSKDASLRPTAEEFLAQMSLLVGADSLRGGQDSQRKPAAALLTPATQTASVAALATPQAVESAPPASPPAPSAAQPSPAPAQTAEFAAVTHRRPRRGPWAIGAVAALAVAAAVTGLVFLLPGPAGGAPRHHHHSPGPAAHSRGAAAVVREYIRDINRKDYRAAWRLGGNTTSSSYRRFVAGFRLTKHVKITRLTVQGQTVSVRTLAYETTGPVQTYAYTYVVQNGKIILGIQNLIGTAP